MAEYEVAAGEVGTYENKLTAETVDTVTFEAYVPGIEIVTDGTAAVYVTFDGTTPVVKGPNCHVLPAQACVRTIRGSGDRTAKPVVKLISSGTPTVSVARTEDGTPRLVAL